MESRIRAWTFGAAVALLAATDWFVAGAPADGEEKTKPSVALGKAVITAEVRVVERDGKKERHAFLDINGEAKGSIKVHLMELEGSPMTRRGYLRTPIWQKDLPVECSQLASVDLGALPEGDSGLSLEASTDGKAWVALIWTAPVWKLNEEGQKK